MTLDERAPTHAERMWDRTRDTHLDPTRRLIALTIGHLLDDGEASAHLWQIGNFTGLSPGVVKAKAASLVENHLVILVGAACYIAGPALTHDKPTEATQITAVAGFMGEAKR